VPLVASAERHVEGRLVASVGQRVSEPPVAAEVPCVAEPIEGALRRAGAPRAGVRQPAAAFAERVWRRAPAGLREAAVGAALARQARYALQVPLSAWCCLERMRPIRSPLRARQQDSRRRQLHIPVTSFCLLPRRPDATTRKPDHGSRQASNVGSVCVEFPCEPFIAHSWCVAEHRKGTCRPAAGLRPAAERHDNDRESVRCVGRDAYAATGSHAKRICSTCRKSVPQQPPSTLMCRNLRRRSAYCRPSSAGSPMSRSVMVSSSA
jgi:hypothetical protein